MKAATKEKEAAETAAAYETVRSLIYYQIHKFHNSFGGDIEEIEGEAHLAFMKGHIQFKKGVRPNGEKLDTEYHTEIRLWVWFELFDAMRVRTNRNNIVRIAQIKFPEDLEDKFQRLDVDLSARAHEVMLLVLDGPPELMRKAQRKGGTPRNIRSTVREWLTFMDWTPEEINDTFEEIRLAL